MNNKEKEIEKLLLNHERRAFRDIKHSYDQALKDIQGRVLNLQNKLNEINAMDVTGYDERSLEIWESMKQSKIYQLQYQKALEEQVGACIEVLKKDTVTNIQTYLDETYKDSYMGSLYNINAKGIPITTPVNPSMLARTVNKKIDGMTFAQRVNDNMNKFKTKVKQEISRGIANGSTYNEIAQQLSMRTGEDLYKSQRIVRTEGGRVSTEARLTSIRDAKEKGADLVKQWDSTLDGKTRPLHRLLDQQWAEVDEPFDADGTPVMGPCLFGDPAEDCNCRCVLLSVPRWDIEDTVVKWDNENNQFVETKNYEEWKLGYYRRLAEEELKDEKLKDDRIAKLKAIYDKIENKGVIVRTSELDLLDKQLMIDNLNKFDELIDKYPIVKKYAEENMVTISSQEYDDDIMMVTVLRMNTGSFVKHSNTVYFNSKNYKNYDKRVEEDLKDMLSGLVMPASKKAISSYNMAHEFGHVLENVMMITDVEQAGGEITERLLIEKSDEYVNEIIKIAKKKNPDFDLKENLSLYAQDNGTKELFAEAFANMICGNPNELGSALKEFLKRRGM